MLNSSQIKIIQKALAEAQNPFFIFHDDPDGLASYLLLRKHYLKGAGMPVKAKPHITDDYCRYVEEYGADVVFVLDIALVDQEFIDNAGVPVYWIDHHPIQEPKRAHYFNSRSTGKNIPTPVMCYQITQNSKYLWIATAGAIGDWYFPEYSEEFRLQYPDLLPQPVNTVPDALYNTLLGVLIHVFSFNLKGESANVRASIKHFLTIEDPYEILTQTSPAGAYVWKHYLNIKKAYDLLKDKALRIQPNDGLYVFTYTADTVSLTKDLANELLYRFPNTIIILGRHKSGEYRCSIRAPSHINIAEHLPSLVQGIRAKGGGHEQALGVGVHEDDWEVFLGRVREVAGKFR
ncbi:MAG: DHH family phosphoesterase [Candidatus Woesearchaeota archaeon]|nr:DHH family phosphoesterase [Candidatus Woesearchaeota archaeon]